MIGLHRHPRAVHERAGLRRPADGYRRADRHGGGRAAVGVGVPAGPRGVGGLADVHVRAVGEDEIRVHWDPSVRVSTPGWTVAVADGAHGARRGWRHPEGRRSRCRGRPRPPSGRRRR